VRGARRAVVALAAVALSGCSFTVGRLATLATTDLDPADPPAAGPLVEGRSCVHVGFVFPVTPLPSIERAASQALAEAGRQVLHDVEIRYELFYLPVFYGRSCYVVRGRAS
jgi:hypothetical protein